MTVNKNNVNNLMNTVSWESFLTDEMTVTMKTNVPVFKDDTNNLLTINEDANENSCDNITQHPLTTTIASSLASDTSLNHRQKQKIQRRVKKFISKSEYTRPDVSQLKYEFDTTDISTITFINTISEIVPIQERILHPTSGMVTAVHPDIKDAIELVEFQSCTSTHRHI